MECGVLGDLTVERDGNEVAISGRGPRTLLALLIANANRAVSMDAIVDALWEDDPPATAHKVVQTYVSQLRRQLEPDAPSGGWRLLRTTASGYELAIPPDCVDAQRFEALVADGSRAPSADAARILREALGLWRGTPYQGIDRSFAVVEARRLEELRTAARERCLEAELAQGADVISELEELVATHPLHERYAELLMTALYRDGRQAEALGVYSDIRERLAQELGVDPGPQLAQVHRDVLRHDAGLKPARRPSPLAQPRRHNLPTERSSFVGRDAAVREVRDLVGAHRLVTLVGAGGAGKTRLAVRVAVEEHARFDGAWLAELATLVDAGRIAGHVLSQLGLTEQMGRTPMETLLSWLGDRRVLLVVDNCEHLGDAVSAFVEELLATCPNLHVLATSRQPLRCTAERLWRVPSLDLPGSPDPVVVLASGSGRLFCDRAAEFDPSFSLDARTAPGVFEICRRLDGIPLAIELAAARVGSMSVADIAAHLDDRFQLLTGGRRSALPRQRTLLATTEWSVGLLSPEQRLLLCRASVFVAGFDLQAAVEVCGFAPLDARAIAGLLADLVDRSLVQTVEVDGGTRYRLLETVRQYGAERAQEEAELLADRYGAWAAALAERVGEGSLSSSVRWYRRLDLDFPHLHAAFVAAMERKDAATALRIAAGPGWSMVINGRFNHLRDWLRQALALARAGDAGEVDGQAMAQGVLMAGALAAIDQRGEQAEALLGEAVDRFDRHPTAAGTLWTRYWLAASAAEQGRLELARTRIRTASEMAARAGQPTVEAYCRVYQGELALLTFDPEREASLEIDEARTALRRAAQLAAAGELEEAAARVEVDQALLTAFATGDYETALHECKQGLEAWRRFGRGNRLIVGLVAAGRLAVLAGRPDEAVELTREGLELARAVAWTAPLRGALEVLAVAAAPEDPERAATLLGAAQSWPTTHRWHVPLDTRDADDAVARAIGEAESRRRRAEGSALGFDAALALALDAVPVVST